MVLAEEVAEEEEKEVEGVTAEATAAEATEEGTVEGGGAVGYRETEVRTVAMAGMQEWVGMRGGKGVVSDKAETVVLEVDWVEEEGKEEQMEAVETVEVRWVD